MSNFNTPTEDELMQKWIKAHPKTAYGLGNFYLYDQGFWRITPETVVKGEILDILIKEKKRGVRPSNHLVKSVCGLCKLGAQVDDAKWNANPNILVCKNGTYDLAQFRFRAHSCDDYATWAVPYAYSETATAQSWQRLLSLLPADVVPFLQEFAGYCLTKDTSHETAVWLYGPPGSGKSSFILGLLAMIGENNSCEINYSTLEKSRFSLAKLFGKTMGFSTEQPARTFHYTDLFNRIISGEPTTGEEKFKNPFEFRPTMKLIWAMNELPRISSAENGLFRRVKLVQFPEIPEASRDSRIKTGIETEGAGILNWALIGLQRLYQRGRFDVPESIRNTSQGYKESSDPARLFIASECQRGENLQTQSRVLYNTYKSWCERNSYSPLSETRLSDTWKTFGFEVFEKKGCRYYRGIGLGTPTGQ